MTVMLIGEDGEKLGNVELVEAERIAKGLGKNLILVNAENSVYKIADEGKLKYDQKQKKKKQRAARKTHKVKDIQLSPTIGTHDLEVKSRRAAGFLNKGHKTKLTMKFKRRQIAHKDIGIDKMNEFIGFLEESGIASVDRPPEFEGKNLVAFLVSAKE